MLKDAQGLVVSTDAPIVIETIDSFTHQLLSYSNQADIIYEALTVESTNALVNSYVAALHLFAETRDAAQLAQPYLQKAHQSLDTVTERERWFIQAIAAWAVGDIDRALAYHEAIALHYPCDLVSALVAQYHYFYQGKNQALLTFIHRIHVANPENSFVHGMLAFALEECHQLKAAEAIGRKAVKLNRCDPWAHHAVAHVLHTQGRTHEGIAWMESLADTWETCGTFYTHNWWHVALYYLAQQEVATVLEIYDRHVWGRAVKSYSQCQVDAIALLVRLELHGIDVGDRWHDVTKHVIPHALDHVMPFTDSYLIYALGHTQDHYQGVAMLDSMTRHTNAIQPTHLTWIEVALPIAQGMFAHAIGNWSEAVKQLAIGLPNLQRLGGSHAQRELFHLVYEDAINHAKTR